MYHAPFSDLRANAALTLSPSLAGRDEQHRVVAAEWPRFHRPHPPRFGAHSAVGTVSSRFETAGDPATC